MALIHTVTQTRVVKPSVAGTFANGSPPSHLLRDVADGYGSMLILPSLGRQALAIAAIADGIYFTSVGRGRSLATQYNMLHQRYRRSPSTTRDTNYVQGHWWQGNWYPTALWYNYTGAMVAVPGTSNHGWYCADDIAERVNGQIVGLTDRGLTWLRDNGPSFGFALETWVERWHWHWIAGDNLPRRVIDVLSYVGIPIDGQPNPNPPPPVPVPNPDPDPTPLPPFDPANRQYSLWAFINPKPNLELGSTGDAVRYLQGVLKHEVGRFAAVFAANAVPQRIGNEINPRWLYMVACRDSCYSLDVDGDYGQKTADAVGFLQNAFRWTSFDGQQWGELTPDKKVGNAETWPFIDAQSNGIWAG